MNARRCEYCRRSLEKATKPGTYYMSYDVDVWRLFCSAHHADLFYRDKYQIPLPLDNTPLSNRGVTSPSKED